MGEPKPYKFDYQFVLNGDVLYVCGTMKLADFHKFMGLMHIQERVLIAIDDEEVTPTIEPEGAP